MKKIADSTREQIVSMYRSGRLHREISEETGVSMATVGRICREAGLDKYHVGGRMSKTCPVTNDALPAPQERPAEPLIVTGRTLNLHGQATGCDYVAGTNTESVDITLGDTWALSIKTDQLSGFIAELEHIRKLIGAR